MIAASGVEHFGKRYSVTSQVFTAAIQKIVGMRDSLDLPFKNHNYLVFTLTRDAPKEAAKAEKLAEKQKRELSQRRLRQAVSDEDLFARIRAEHQQAEARRLLREQKAGAPGIADNAQP